MGIEAAIKGAADICRRKPGHGEIGIDIVDDNRSGGILRRKVMRLNIAFLIQPGGVQHNPRVDQCSGCLVTEGDAFAFQAGERLYASGAPYDEMDAFGIKARQGANSRVRFPLSFEYPARGVGPIRDIRLDEGGFHPAGQNRFDILDRARRRHRLRSDVRGEV